MKYLLLAITLLMMGCSPEKVTVEKGPDYGPRIAAQEALLQLNSQKDALLEARVTALENRADATDATLASVQSTVAANKAAADAAIAALGGVDANLQAQIDALFARVANLEAADAGFAISIAGITADLNLTIGRVSSLEGNVAGLLTSLGSLSTSLSNLTIRVTQHDVLLATINSQISGMTGQINSLSTSLTALVGTVGANTTAINTLIGQVTTISSSISGLTSQLSSLSGTVTAHGTALNAQLVSITNLQSAMTLAQTKIVQAQADILALQNAASQIINTCGTEKLVKIGGKLYGVVHNVQTTQVTLPVSGLLNTVSALQCSLINIGGTVCLGGFTNISIPVPTISSVATTLISSVASYLGEIQNGTYHTTDTLGTPGATGCSFTVNNGNVTF